MKRPTVAIIHYRLHSCDGVSLEIDKRIQLLRQYPLRLVFITGHCPSPPNNNYHLLPFLNLNSPSTKKLFSFFFHQRHPQTKVKKIYQEKEKLFYQKLKNIINQEKINFLVIHNLLSLPLIPPASSALLQIIKEKRIKTLAVNHDFWFNRPYLYQTPQPFIRKILNQFPPKEKLITHQVINSLDQEALLKRKRIKAQRIGDYWDFDQPPLKKNHFNRRFLSSFGIKENDLLLLQATRIVPRKAIENSIIFAKELEQELKKRAPLKINHHKTFLPSSRVVLFLSNFPDWDFLSYYRKLKEFAQKKGVKAVWAYRRIQWKRKLKNQKKIFSFWDPYLFADLITYPSIAEGFGNQFLEACFFKKPIVLFEYPVFQKDIKKEGYCYISLGKKVSLKNGFHLVPQQKIKKAVAQTIEVLTQPRLYQTMVEKNYSLAARYHSFSLLKKDLEKNLIYPLFRNLPKR